MDMPWKKIAPINAKGEYLALLTYLPLKKQRTIPRFLWSTFAIQKQLASSAGILGYALRAKPLQLVVYYRANNLVPPESRR